MNADAAYWIDTLELIPHPEGGFYRETYRSQELIESACLPERYHRNRAMATAIYYLLRRGERSRLHRLRSDEIWHFHAGSTLRLTCLSQEGVLQEFLLGSDPLTGAQFQLVIPAGTWFGARVDRDGEYSLVSCTVAPGFDFSDFELGSRAELSAAFPQHAAAIEALTDG